MTNLCHYQSRRENRMNHTELRTWRRKHKISQAGVGRLLHVTSTTVYRWESAPDKAHHVAIPYHFSLLLKFMPAGTIAQQRTHPRHRA
jgi:DNA-binding XRE family transcriptional regulator